MTYDACLKKLAAHIGGGDAVRRSRDAGSSEGR